MHSLFSHHYSLTSFYTKGMDLALTNTSGLILLNISLLTTGVFSEVAVHSPATKELCTLYASLLHHIISVFYTFQYIQERFPWKTYVPESIMFELCTHFKSGSKLSCKRKIHTFIEKVNIKVSNMFYLSKTTYF